MNEFQYKLVKTFLGFPLVTAKKIAKAWGVDLSLILMVERTANYESFAEIPEEDLALFGGKL